MRLLRTDCSELKLEEFVDERTLPKYAIVSHTWLEDEEEITHDELEQLHRMTSKVGWTKLDSARRQAFNDGYCYIWIDTCCINKSSSAELAEAINSMYRWYRMAEICYVYLADMPDPVRSLSGDTEAEQPTKSSTTSCGRYSPDANQEYTADSSQRDYSSDHGISSVSITWDATAVAEVPEKSESLESRTLADTSELSVNPDLDTLLCDWNQFRACKWFTRGWTLQELLASRQVQFFSTSWNCLGSLSTLRSMVASVTGIHISALNGERPISSFSVAQRMSWASSRQTKRIEDEAYSLLGILDVNMPIIYGEGRKSFVRLQAELLRLYSDHTIFAWPGREHTGETNDVTKIVDDARSGLLASSPHAFKGCGNLVPIKAEGPHGAYEDLGKTVRFEGPLIDSLKEGLIAVLNCRFEDDFAKIMCINLRPTLTHNLYTVADEHRVQRVQMLDIYTASRSCNIRAFTIARYNDSVRDIMHARHVTKGTILCRLRHREVTLSDSPKEVWPNRLWRSVRSCIPHTSLRTRVSDQRSSSHPSEFHFRGIPLTAGAAWHATQKSFNVPCSCADDTSACHCQFKGKLDILHDEKCYGTLRIERNTVHGLSVYFERDDGSSIMTALTRMNILPESMAVHGGTTMLATSKNHHLIYANMDVVEVSIQPTPLLMWLRFCFRNTGLTLIWLTLSCAPFVLTVVIPVVAITIARPTVTSGAKEFGLDMEAQLGMAIGIPIACLVCSFALFKKDRIFGIAPGGLVDVWFGVMNDPLHAVRSHFRGHHRVLLLALEICLCFALAALDISYAIVVLKRRHFFEQHGMTPLLTKALYDQAWEPAMAYAAGMVMTGILFCCYRPLSRRLKIKSIGGKYALLGMLLPLIIIVPFGNILHEHSAVLAPWSNLDCQSENVSDRANAFFVSVASATGQSIAEVCSSFAWESRLMLSILSLSIWAMIVNIWTMAYILWLVFRLSMPLKNKLWVF